MLIRIKLNIILFFQLIKVTVTLPVTFLAFISYSIFKSRIDHKVWIVCLAVFMLAGAASSLNQIIENRFDGLMARTQKRPIPSGRIGPKNALLISLVLTVFGILLLTRCPLICIVLSLFNLGWYLGIYTFLKRITPFAVIPGSITGAIPVLIGWTAAGGYIFDPEAIYIAFFVFLWQMPHFWLLMLIYGNEYQAAGYPTLFKVFNLHQVRIWTMVWILSANVISMAFPFFGLVNNIYIAATIIILNIVIVSISFTRLVADPDQYFYKSLFHLINLSMILILVLITVGKL